MPQVLTGKVLMVANAKQSYDLTIECKIEVTRIPFMRSAIIRDFSGHKYCLLKHSGLEEPLLQVTFYIFSRCMPYSPKYLH